MSRSALLAALPGGSGDEHAVEMAVARLRGALGDPKIVQTVVKRGYRLAIEPGECAGETQEDASSGTPAVLKFHCYLPPSSETTS